MNMVVCYRDKCNGVVEDGYCTLCGHAPVADREVLITKRTGNWPRSRGSNSAFSPGEVVAGLQGKARLPERKARANLRPEFGTKEALAHREDQGGALVSLPQLPSLQPEEALLRHAEVPEHRRLCGGCDAPLRRESGFCGQCGARYNFAPVLHRGDLIAGQYEVKGPIAFGGLGWIYLAFDRLLLRYVVLKGLLNAQDSSAAAAAVAERQFLAALKHPDIVDIYNFVQVGGEGFIVMEYIGGQTLKQIRQTRGPLPPAEAIGYMLRILPAFSYLHRRGLVLCDFKPDNMMVEHDGVKLIDLGAVRHIDDPHGDIYGTVGYSAPEAGEGPTVASDLFTIGRTLAVLLMEIPAFGSDHRFTLPETKVDAVLARHESLHLFLLRATAAQARDRFQGANEMAEQLHGVLREVVACTQGVPQPGLSRAFGPDPLAFAAGDAAEPVAPDAYGLPAPTLDPCDPAEQAVSLALFIPDLQQRTTALGSVCAQSPGSLEATLRLAGTYLQMKRVAEAGAKLQSITQQTTHSWRVRWFVGCVHLVCGRLAEASACFDEVVRTLPGELAPKLALALAAELAGKLPMAARLYDLVSHVDPSYPSAAFGLARCERKRGDTGKAVKALNRIPASSALYVRAQVEAARTLLLGGSTGSRMDEVRAAGTMAQTLSLKEQDRLRLERDVLQAALQETTQQRLKGKKGLKGKKDELLLGRAMTARGLRSGLEQTYRRLARFAEGEERQQLIDEANRVRPRTWT